MKKSTIYIIALCGPDGTGKSTHATLLSVMLSRKKYIVRRAWIKNVHLSSFLIVSILEMVNRRRVVRSTSGAIMTSSLAYYNVPWIWIESLNVALKTFSHILLCHWYGLFKKKIFIVADRFILDSLVHILISVTLSRSGLKSKKKVLFKSLESLPFRILRSLSIKYSLNVLLDGKEEVLIERKKKNQKCDPLWYIILQRLFYRLVTYTLSINVYYIDTTEKSINQTFSEILENLEAVIE